LNSGDKFVVSVDEFFGGHDLIVGQGDEAWAFEALFFEELVEGIGDSEDAGIDVGVEGGVKDIGLGVLGEAAEIFFKEPESGGADHLGGEAIATVNFAGDLGLFDGFFVIEATETGVAKEPEIDIEEDRGNDYRELDALDPATLFEFVDELLDISFGRHLRGFSVL